MDVRALLGAATYYRIWIEGFTIIAAPLFILQYKGIKFNCGKELEQAMESIKVTLTNALTLMTPEYRPCAGLLIFRSDAGGEGWGLVLIQLDSDGRRYSGRYWSRLWAPAEKLYDAGKKECKSLLKALKKL